jgi:hypothetical protein
MSETPESSHSVRLFVGPMQSLRALQGEAPSARIFALHPLATLWVMPLDDHVHDSLHRRHGTGEWLGNGPSLTSVDLMIGARASTGSELAYLETNYAGPDGTQSAALWRDGRLILGPITLAAAVPRPARFWPINAALRGLGVVASPPQDEFIAFGLVPYRSHDAIYAQASEVR